ncbi:DNA replication ATP-dependent helicase/nuclease JHS1 isoform X2 [Magnolia sinica]|uniref:DNA replication ATP-dependent helicase/nuclease JHS1 isoform X2 n=1 Tax=Magnolia sinica TaxID=86752 RepID=UPI00265875AE|nr:DNA replication ATP-dependent helicase/nuclease JHS1 isoform X2 [Magnolia sinica]
MAPRKKSSSSSKKSNQIHQSQPSKFGIQHFFDRHTQSAATSTPPHPPPNPPEIPNSQCPNPLNLTPNTNPADPPKTTSNAEENLSEISPDVSKSVSFKRFKFSPGMLIKQTQDDGGEEVTWKISPVNERLRSVTKNLPEMMRVLSDASKLNTLHPCSQKQSSPCSSGKLEKWLSSPTLKAPERSSSFTKRVSFEAFDQEKQTEVCNGLGSRADPNINSIVNTQSPFRTPPSMSYCPAESNVGVVCNGESDHSDSRQHRKALLELLDQVEDVIAVEEPVFNHAREYLLDDQDKMSHEMSVGTDPLEKALIIPSERVCHGHSSVSEKCRGPDPSCAQNPFKVLRLLNEHSGEERILHLYDEWFYSLIGPGDTLNVIGEFDDQGKCIVDRDDNLVIIHPDILVSGTRVAASFTCPRRTVLDERLKCSEHSTAALIGTLLHQIFQAGLLHEFPTRDFLEEYARIVLQKNIESLYACGVNENDIHAKLFEAIPRILNWLTCLRNPKEPRISTVDFGSIDGQKEVRITEVIDIEEMAWAPRYGLKGMIDASIRVRIDSDVDGSNEKVIPLEFKTGKGTSGQSAMEHCAQVILYTLLMSERYLKDINFGLLYYLHTDQTRGIPVRRSDVVGLIMRRNELATDILKASTTQLLPPMLRNPNTCKGCRHLNVCTVYHKVHGGNAESSGLDGVFESYIEHLTSAHFDFLRQWDRLIDLEAKETQVAKREMWRSSGLRRGQNTNSLFSMILDVSNESLPETSSKDGRFFYRLVRQESPPYNSEMQSEDKLNAAPPIISNLDCTLKRGDHVILSTESGRVAVANGVIADIDRFHVSVSLSRKLRLPGSSPSSEKEDLMQEVWQIDKDEFASSYAIMRFNLTQLFVQSARSSHLRRMIVDLEAPRFDSGGIFSQDPAISYVRSEKNMNDDQRRAIHKILTAKDYALILGMPGTGKTSTMVHAVKALLMRGASILLTSYTNSAIDNLLIKLKGQGIDFVRLGRDEAVHDEVRGNCFSATKTHSLEEIKLRINQVSVVGVTCLGINHPLLAHKKFDICIMDEAGQTTLPVSLGPLMFASTFVLVGDHYQLPPLVQSTEARENGMGISLFCRLSEAHPQAISALQCQYRMCAGIMELSNALIYGNRLRCGSGKIANAKLEFSSAKHIMSWLKEVLDHNKSVAFISTDMLPALEKKEHKAVNNPTEAYIVKEVTEELLNRGILGDEIGIITPYNSQANLIRRVVGTPSVEIHTIDKYQGRDKDCILVSFVRSSENLRASHSTLLGDWHRINVAITRAKKKLIMVGSCKTLSKVPLLKLLIKKVAEQSGIVNVSKADIHYLGELKKCSQVSV